MPGNGEAVGTNGAALAANGAAGGHADAAPGPKLASATGNGNGASRSAGGLEDVLITVRRSKRSRRPVVEGSGGAGGAAIVDTN